MICRHIRSTTRCAESRVPLQSARGRIWRLALSLLWAWTCVPAAAITLATAGPLPGAVEACIAARDCSIAQDSSFDLGGIAAFQYLSSDGAGYLVRYALAPSSLAHDSQDFLDTRQDPPLAQHVETLTALSGSLWLGVQGRYARNADFHDLQLYVDRAQPAEQRLLPRFTLSEPPPTVLHFAFSSDALQASQAYRHLLLDSAGSVEEGSLQSAEPLLPCLADGCSVAQSLALVGLGFSVQDDDLVLHFVPQDRRQALYSEEIAYSHPDNSFLWRRDYFVQPVPLPAAGVLMLFGVAPLLPSLRRSRAAS